MNSLIILVTICAFFVVGVRSSNRPYFCEKMEENEEYADTFINCIGENYPPAMLNLVARCYQESFGVSGGTWQDFYRVICVTERSDEKVRKHFECTKNGALKAMSDAGITEEEAGRSFDNAMV